MFLRWYLQVGQYLCKKFNSRLWYDAFEWTLRNPRRVTTHVFLPSETNYLAYFALLSSAVFLVLFMAAELHRNSFVDEYGPWAKATGLGLFQILNLRHCGFTSIAMTDLTQCTLVVFVIAMYMSPLPFIGLLKASGERSLRQVNGIEPDDEDEKYPIVKVLRRVVIKSWFFKFAMLFVLAAVEQDLMEDRPNDVNIFYLVFELVSCVYE